jgi:outer membrane protein OmpA-like peptidoglycan-associated protein
VRRLRALVIGIPALAFGTAPVVAAGNAATYPLSGLTFDAGPIFFPVAPVTFLSGPIAFPSSLSQTETASMIEVTLPADILFDFDRADIRPDAQKPLHEVAELVRQKAHGPVVIQGYTDALGNDAHNQRLSERRAAAVSAWLVAREGLSSVRFTTVGFGPRNPVAPNRKPDGSDDPEGRQLNRRVTLIIRK